MQSRLSVRIVFIVLLGFVGLTDMVNAEWTFEKLTNNIYDDTAFDITPDGGKLVFISDTDRNKVTKWDQEVYVMYLSSGRTERISRDLHSPLFATISDDGRKIFYVNNEGWYYRGYMAEADDWTPRVLVEQYQYYPIRIAYFTPDGNNLIIQTSHTLTGVQTISMVDASTGRKIRDVVRFEVGDNTRDIAEMKHSGNKIIYPDRNSLKIYDISTGYGRTVYTLDSGEEFFAADVSSDGKVVFSLYSREESGRNGLFLYEGGGITQIYRGELKVYDVEISDDGSKIFFYGSGFLGGGKGIYILSEGGAERVLSPGMLGGFASVVDTSRDGSTAVVNVRFSSDPQRDFEVGVIREASATTPISVVEVIDLSLFLPEGTTITFGSAETLPGREVQIPVTIKNAENIGSMNLILNYPDSFEVRNVLPGSLTSDSLFEYNVRNGNISVGIVDTSGIDGDGSLLYVRFGIPAGFNDTASLLIIHATANRVDGAEVDLTLVNGTVSVIEENETLKGDVNGDGEITSVDALMALKMSVGRLDVDLRADMDGDGSVTAKDALEIMKVVNRNMIEEAVRSIRSGIGGISIGGEGMGR